MQWLIGVSQKRFKNNVSGYDWLKNPCKQNQLSKREVLNINVERTSVARESVDVFFDKLEESVIGRICPENLYNYDEN